jgi:microsomal dipeptidase-like Zn-dependent dipeptidase
MHLLFEALEKAGLTQRQIEKFAYGNVLRVLKDTI